MNTGLRNADTPNKEIHADTQDLNVVIMLRHGHTPNAILKKTKKSRAESRATSTTNISMQATVSSFSVG
jgi:hypothetical protein